MATSISPGFKKLLSEPAFAEVATLMADGSPQITQVWVDTDGEHVLINTAENRQKTRNVRRDPRVAINVHDPAKPFRIANIRGRVVEEISAGAKQHVDALAKKYMGADRYSFGQPGQQRIILKIQPERIHTIGLDGDGWQSPG